MTMVEENIREVRCATSADRPRLAVLGAINSDLTAVVDRFPRPGETVADGVLRRAAGGKGANQAVAAARLGAQVRLFGAVGSDYEAQELVRGIAGAGVDVAGVQVRPSVTGSALIAVDADGENAIIVCAGANGDLDDGAMPALEEGEGLLVQLEVPMQAVVRAIASARGFVALNLSPAQPLSEDVFDRVDLFIVNEDEYAAVPALRNAPLVAVTLGGRGALLLARGQEVAAARATAAQVVSTVGAGDAFAAALVVGLLRGDDSHVALHRACLVGAAVVEDPDSQPVLRPLDDYSTGLFA